MSSNPRITAVQIKNKKESQTPIVAVTAYDFLTAQLIDELVDIVLVGDSLGMVVQGLENTLAVSVDQIVYHTRAVKRGLKHAHLVADMPFMSYQTNPEDALRNAGRLLSEAGADAVKLEGGVSVAKTVERLVDSGIPVMGHVGLTPQSVNQFGGYKIQGKSQLAQESILHDALALEDSGAYSIVLEGIPCELAKNISSRLKIPTIGIGAGVGCNGQILVLQDLLGMNPNFKPRFVKQYANLADAVRTAVQSYAQEVREYQFPSKEHSFFMEVSKD